MGASALRQDVEAARGSGKRAEAEIDDFRIRYSGLRNPDPHRLEREIDDVLVPAWRALGRRDALELVVAKGLENERGLLECLADADREIALRGRDVLLLHQSWKENGIPADGNRILAKLEVCLATFYIATGAKLQLSEMLERIRGSIAI